MCICGLEMVISHLFGAVSMEGYFGMTYSARSSTNERFIYGLINEARKHAASIEEGEFRRKEEEIMKK